MTKSDGGSKTGGKCATDIRKSNSAQVMNKMRRETGKQHVHMEGKGGRNGMMMKGMMHGDK